MKDIHFNRRAMLGSALAGMAAPAAHAQAVAAVQQSAGAAPSTGAVGGVQGRSISPRDFGAAGDGSRDDAPAVQAAIDACLQSVIPTPLRVDGVFRLDRTVTIDRPTGQVGPRFHIIGADVGAAFHVVGDVTMFSTTLPVRNNPLSEGISFRNIVFSADQPTRNAQCFAGGLFRMTFDHCDWYQIRCLASPIYAQSWRFTSCRAYEWRGIFFQSAGSYDIVLQIESKFGDTILESVSNTWPTLRMRVHDSVIEGIRGAAIRCGRASGLMFDGNYCEFNGGPSLDLTAHAEGNSAVTVQANTFVQTDAALADGEFFDVRWGNTHRGFAVGNYCNGRLHDTAGMTSANLLTISGDVAELELYRGYTTDPQARRSVGNVQVTLGTQASLSMNGRTFGADPVLGGFSVGQEALPQRLVFGPESPAADNARYGNIAWGTGSRIFNDAPAPGRPKGWICVAGGTPGRWVAEEVL